MVLCKKHGLTKSLGIKRERCSKCNVEKVTLRRAKLKQLSIDYKGGCCNICGYKKYIGALEFHHIDPSVKEHGLTSSNTNSWDRVKIELDKCVLLCANCHREVHEEIRLSN